MLEEFTESTFLEVTVMKHHTHTHTHTHTRTDGSDGKISACNTGDVGSVSGWGRPPGEGHGSPLQYS